MWREATIAVLILHRCCLKKIIFKMASLLREFSFCDKDQNNGIISALYNQKNDSNFCDVIMKVCGSEIFAHSNILAAASPYFQSFLTQDLPRQFSQRTPQVIEIQIDGNEPNILYEEAVSAVIDFIYTGKMVIRESNVAQICEIGRIMQMDNVVNFCSDFANGKQQDPVNRLNTVDACVGTDPSSHNTEFAVLQQRYMQKMKPNRVDPAFQKLIKSKKLVSAAIQVYPHMLPEMMQPKNQDNFQDKATATDSRYFESLKQIAKPSVKKKILSPKKAIQPPRAKNKTLRYILYSPELSNTNKENILNEESGELLPADDVPDEETNITGDVDLHPSVDLQPTVVLQRIIDLQPTVDFLPEEDNENNAPSNTNESTSEPLASMEDEAASVVQSSNEQTPVDQLQSEDTVVITSVEDTSQNTTSKVSSPLPMRRSKRAAKPTAKLQELQDMPLMKRIKLEPRDDKFTVMEDIHAENPTYAPEDSVYEMSEQIKATKGSVKEEQEVEAAERLLSLAEGIVHPDGGFDDEHIEGNFIVEEITDAQNSEEHFTVQEVMEEVCYEPRNDEDEYDDEDFVVPAQPGRGTRKYVSTRRSTTNTSPIQVGPGKYSCDSCAFNTNKVREMSAHIKLHKLENNTCYYCEDTFDNKEVLTAHMDKHKGPNPFFCHVCFMRFKSRTLLNMHLPKHSDNKPFICEVCCASFKWKHALKCHMITHSNKKEHLCDTCGFATAHKSQLKAHRKIHTGDTYKCDHEGCTFEATKMQNMRYHLLTHTKEKPHQCDMCGQNFSLVKNLRRHMLLHAAATKLSCHLCTFTSTRADKLKEHLLKIHGVGTPPERRLRVTDMVLAQKQRSSGMRSASVTLTVPGMEDTEIPVEMAGDTDTALIKLEGTEIIAGTTHEMEIPAGDDTDNKITTIQDIAQIAGMATQSGNETTLIEIVQDGAVQIFPEQSILISQGEGEEGSILHSGQFTEVVQIDGQNIVLTDNVPNTIATTVDSSRLAGLVSAGEMTLVQSVDSALIPTMDAHTELTTDTVDTGQLVLEVVDDQIVHEVTASGS